MAEGRSLIRQRNAIEDRAVELLADRPDYLLLRTIPGIGPINALTILAELLGGSGTTSVLTRALQFDTQTAVYSSAFYDGTSVDADTFGVVVMPVPGVSLADAEAAMDAVLAKFLKEGDAPADFARIKTQIRASEIYARDDAMGLAQQYGQALAVGLSVDDVKAWPEVLQAVTEADVMAAANAVLNRNNAVTGWLARKEEATK